MSLLSNLFGTKKNQPIVTKRKENRIRPALESLENRDLMAAYLSGGNLVIAGTSGNDTVTVHDYSASYYRVNFNGSNQYFLKSAITTGNTFFYGYEGNDYFNSYVPTALRNVCYGGNGNDTLIGYNNTDWLYGQDGDDTLYGYAGNDVLDGGNGNDKLHGMSGNDWLYGGTGNDKLYGGTGYDYLYGQDGNDFLDAGSSGEYVNGGNGYDFNAFIVAVSGATYTDIYQGNSPTCWLVSSISSVARTGVNLASRISYLGNNSYCVYMYNTSNVWSPVYVTFDGDTYSADARANPSQEGESWVLITQRAYLQSRGISLTNPPGGWASGPLTALTGRSSTTYNDPSGAVGGTHYNRIVNALNAGRNVVADTADNSADLTTNMLVAWHQYTVCAVSGSWVLVRNPWGYDGGTTTYGDANDGFIWLSWSNFCGSMDAYIIN